MRATSKTSSSATSSGKRTLRRTAQQRSRQRARAFQVSAILLALVGIAVVVFLINSNDRPGISGDIEGVRTFPNLDRGHSTQPVTYSQNPPAGGVHNPAWQNCGVYTDPVPSENAVHSLEHGAIWITHQPDLPAEEVQKLQSITRQSSYRLLSPYPGLNSPIVLSAWGYQLTLEQADDPRLMAFIEKYEQNPRGPEPGASCNGGVGQPG